MFNPAAPAADYALLWPRGLFRAEATALASRSAPTREWIDEASWLLDDAFAGQAPVRDLRRVSSSRILLARQQAAPQPTSPDRPDLSAVLTVMQGLTTLVGDPQQQYLQYLADQADALPLWDPAPYWPARDTFLATPADPRLPLAQKHWAALVEELQRKGYLARMAPGPCSKDDPDSPPSEYWLENEVATRLGISDLWWPRLRPGAWERDTFLGLVEVVHDLVARPQRRLVHRHRGLPACGWKFTDFSTDTGQVVYRWQVDQLFARHRLDLRFAAIGEDIGRLVHGTGDDRDGLVRTALASPDPTDRDAIRHAVALFRSRGATREDKRSAIVALGRILEERRALIKTELGKKDDGALFEIANQFDLRHRDPKQRSDYDDAYLDWIFWSYLNTVELTDRLLARQKVVVSG